MLRLIRWFFWLAATLALVYFAATVPLGSKTLVQHVAAIFRTREAKDLATGTRDKAEEVAGRMRRELSDEKTPPSPEPQQQRPLRNLAPGLQRPSQQRPQQTFRQPVPPAGSEQPE